MRKNVLIILILSLVFNNFVFGQNDSLPKSNPLYWTFELGTSFLTNTKTVKNQPFRDINTLSGSWYFYYDIPIRIKRNQNLNYGYSFAPGLGFGFNTFSIDKQLMENLGKTEFVNINTDYNYYYFQNTYLDIPLEFRYLTKPNAKMKNFSFDFGGKIGYLIYTEKELSAKIGDDIITTTTKKVNNMNKIRYGFSGKISYRNLKLSRNKKEYVGFAYSLHANYYPSEIFVNNNGFKTQYFSFGLGLSFIFK